MALSCTGGREPAVSDLTLTPGVGPGQDVETGLSGLLSRAGLESRAPEGAVLTRWACARRPFSPLGLHTRVRAVVSEAACRWPGPARWL